MAIKPVMSAFGPAQLGKVTGRGFGLAGTNPYANVKPLQSRPNPALAALSGGIPQSAGPTSRLGKAAPAAAGYSPNTSLTADQKAAYDSRYAANDANAQKIQDIGQRNIAAMGRKNAMLAAMSGSGGGAAYLSGQRAALSSGLATMDQALLANSQARDAIGRDQTVALGALAVGAQNHENTMGVKTFDAAREDERFKQESLAGGLSAQGARTDDKLGAMLEKGWTKTSDAWNDYARLSQLRDQAVGAGDYAAAQRYQDQLTNFDYGLYTEDGHRK